MVKRRGRPNLGRSKTTKERAVFLYAPTEKMHANWKSEADKHGMSLSGYLVEIIDDAMRRSSSGISPREKTEKELAQATLELEGLRKQNESLRVHLKRTEESEARYRNTVYELAEYAQNQSRDDELIEKLIGLFKKQRVWQIEEIPPEVGINVTDGKAMKPLADAISYLKRIGLIDGDFGELRCRIGARKKTAVPLAVRRKRLRKHRARIPRRLQSARDDAQYGTIVCVEPEGFQAVSGQQEYR